MPRRLDSGIFSQENRWKGQVSFIFTSLPKGPKTCPRSNTFLPRRYTSTGHPFNRFPAYGDQPLRVKSVDSSTGFSFLRSTKTRSASYPVSSFPFPERRKIRAGLL